MFDDLRAAERRYEEIAFRLSDPATTPDAYAGLMKDYKELTPLVESYRQYRQLEFQVREARDLLEAGGEDPEFLAMIQQESRENCQKLEELEENIKLLLLPKDADDEKSVILEIRAGAGGEEAALFAHSLFRMYSMYAAKQGWRCEVISENATELGGARELVASIEGAGVYSRMKFESGVHRVQRVPATETQGRITTSTIKVAVMPEAE